MSVLLSKDLATDTIFSILFVVVPSVGTYPPVRICLLTVGFSYFLRFVFFCVGQRRGDRYYSRAFNAFSGRGAIRLLGGFVNGNGSCAQPTRLFIYLVRLFFGAIGIL